MIKKKMLSALAVLSLFTVVGSVPARAQDDIIYLGVAGEQLEIKLENNTATSELKAALAEGDITISMSRNGDFEQYGDIGRTFTTSNTSISSEPGDVLLYASRYLCVFYGENSYSYTRIGKIQGKSEAELRELLSKEDYTMVLSANPYGEVPNTGVADMTGRVKAMLFSCLTALAAVAVILFRRREKIR